jgi:hypothetical protein
MDMRSQLRFRTDMQVTVTCLDPLGPPLGARLADISANGLGLLMDRQIHPGSPVKVEWGKTVLFCEILHCQTRGQEFYAGLEVEDAIFDNEAALWAEQSW